MTTVASMPTPAPTVRRSSRSWRARGIFLTAVLLMAAAVPQVFGLTVVEQGTELLTLILLATMWNALAGYAGLVSVGQQCFIGVGAYATIWLTQQGLAPYAAIVLAPLAAGVLAVVLAPVVLRLRGGQFAVGTWVIAETAALLVMLDDDLGGGTGTSLRGLNAYPPPVRHAYTYWLALAAAVLLFGALFLLLRSRSGIALQAARDSEQAAAAAGVRTWSARVRVYVLAAVGCGAAGALTLANTLFVQPRSIFGAHWSAYLIFMVLVGGIGTLEGPVLGAVAFFAVESAFGDQGAWYLVGLGVMAIFFTLFVPRGLWGGLSRRDTLSLFPLRYHLTTTERG
ncbi:branched-chain amino acid ABC transporter permease [Micromonospora mangrovi]|uniref:Branched-chain amino acid ABC transporter permease n=2 Tax=Micromonospora TaxID=1873 RepID=A0AAU8HJI1_9ACTN